MSIYIYRWVCIWHIGQHTGIHTAEKKKHLEGSWDQTYRGTRIKLTKDFSETMSSRRQSKPVLPNHFLSKSLSYSNLAP